MKRILSFAIFLSVLTLGLSAGQMGVSETKEATLVLAAPKPLGTRTTIPGADAIKLVDAHDHLMPELKLETMTAIMDRLGITEVVAMGRGGRRTRSIEAAARVSLEAYERLPNRVIPFIGLNQIHEYTRSTLNEIDRQLATGKFQGMGEFLARHYAGTGPREIPDVTIPMDSLGAQDVMCLAAKYNVALTVHMETTNETIVSLERALQKNPNTKIIWAHQNHLKYFGGPEHRNARTADPQQIAALLDKYSNLYADLAPGRERASLEERDRRLPDQWKSLYERYKDRFVVGLDNPFIDGWLDTQGAVAGISVIAAFAKDWLAQLSPETQRKIATENIKRILGAKPASIRTCQFSTAE